MQGETTTATVVSHHAVPAQSIAVTWDQLLVRGLDMLPLEVAVTWVHAVVVALRHAVVVSYHVHRPQAVAVPVEAATAVAAAQAPAVAVPVAAATVAAAVQAVAATVAVAAVADLAVAAMVDHQAVVDVVANQQKPDSEHTHDVIRTLN